MKSFNVLGVKVNPLTFDEILDQIKKGLSEKRKLKIYTINNEFVVAARGDRAFLKILNDSTISIIDSTGIAWAVQYLYKENDIRRTPGADLFWLICAQAERNRNRIFLLGGKNNAGKISKNILLQRFPDLEIDYLDNIKIDQHKTDEEINNKINHFGADIVMVALGAPKQEVWIDTNVSCVKAAVFIGIGGTLDFVSGNIKRAPLIFRDLGLEWLYRLIKEPRRLKRIFTATIIFPYLILRYGKRADY